MHPSRLGIVTLSRWSVQPNRRVASGARPRAQGVVGGAPARREQILALDCRSIVKGSPSERAGLITSLMRIAAFISHPIQYFTPLWQEVSRRPNVHLKVFYFSRQGLDPSFDPGFGKLMAWDMDLLAGHESQFLPRQ